MNPLSKTSRCLLLAAACLLPVLATAAHAAAAGTAVYSAAALYNQANADARNGRIGPAILNYERARLLAPDNADIVANLDFIRTQAGLPKAPENEFVRRLGAMPPNPLAWLGCAGLVLAGLGLLAARCFPRRRAALRLATLAGTLLVAATVGNAVVTWPRVHEAVVLANETPAHLSPAKFAEPAFMLKAGETVTVQSEHADFLLVQTPAGRTGWVALKDLARVVPTRAGL